MLHAIGGHTQWEFEEKQLFLEKWSGKGSNQGRIYDLIGTWPGLEQRWHLATGGFMHAGLWVEGLEHFGYRENV